MRILKLFFVFTFLFVSAASYAQGGGDEQSLFDSLLNVKVKVENPVYKPIVGFGLGVLNFYGEVHNRFRSPLVGQPAYKLNIATFLDRQHYFKTNFVLLMGSLSGNSRSSTDTAWNMNFKTDIFSLGVNIHYDFNHLIKKSAVRPFISLGIENLQFNSKTYRYYRSASDDLDHLYYYWSDGTTRNISESKKYTTPPSQIQIVKPDNGKEENLSTQNLHGLGSYSQNTFAIPLDVGMDIAISDRVNLRIGQSWHYTFTDNIDDISSKSTPKGDKWNDMFTYSYFTVHFDLFSEARVKTIEKLFAEVNNFDYNLYGDDDNDGVIDLMDKCPGTLSGVRVDSVGCPLDDDKDGIPNYLDKELETRRGAFVDENGIEIGEEELAAMLNTEGIKRKDVDVFLLMHRAQSRYRGNSSRPVPKKFKSLDTDGDGYISFEELLKAIDNFFDFSSTLSSKDIYELQD
jgi:hypothetical protein